MTTLHFWTFCPEVSSSIILMELHPWTICLQVSPNDHRVVEAGQRRGIELGAIGPDAHDVETLVGVMGGPYRHHKRSDSHRSGFIPGRPNVGDVGIGDVEKQFSSIEDTKHIATRPKLNHHLFWLKLVHVLTSFAVGRERNFALCIFHHNRDNASLPNPLDRFRVPRVRMLANNRQLRRLCGMLDRSFRNYRG